MPDPLAPGRGSGVGRIGRFVEPPLRGDQRIELYAARISAAKSSGSSHAAKCPPLSTWLKWTTLGYVCSVQLRGAGKTSPGNTVYQRPVRRGAEARGRAGTGRLR